MVSTQKVIARQQMAPVEGACRLSARVLKKHIETHGRFRDGHGKAQQNQWYHPDKSSPTRRSKTENQSTVPAVRASVFERKVTGGTFTPSVGGRRDRARLQDMVHAKVSARALQSTGVSSA